MAEEWRIREVFNQTLLFFALGVRDRLVEPGRKASAVAPPLPPFREQPIQQQIERILGEIDGVLDEVKQKKCDLDSLKTKLNTKLDRLGGWRANLDRVAPWRIGEVVDWWLDAGVAMAQWKKSMMRPDGGDRAGAADRRPPASALERWLWHTTIRRLQVEDDEEYPPVWCVDHVDSWKLGGSRPSGLRPGWGDRDAGGPDECRLALLDWCGDPVRERAAFVQGGASSPAVDDWAKDYEARQRDFARFALRLMRRRCRFAPQHDPNSDHAYRWRLASTDQSPSMLRVLRRPLMMGDGVEGGGSVVTAVPGWYVSPWPAAVVEQCRKVTEIGRPHGSVTRAIAAAAAAFTSEDRSFAPLPPWSLEGPDGFSGVAFPAGVERLAATARLAVIEDVMMQAVPADGRAMPAGVKPVGGLRDALFAEGVRLRRASADVAACRRIPFNVGSLPTRSESASLLVMEGVGSKSIVEVGVVGQPARCPDELLAAIEEFDWRWWALGGIRGAWDRRQSVDHLAGFPAAAEWEPLKSSLLDLDPQSPDLAAKLASAFSTLDTWLAKGFASQADGAEAAVWLAPLEDHIKGVQSGVLRWLLEIDPAGQGGLYPNRTADGCIDLVACATDGARSHAGAAEWDVTWRRSKERFGVQIGEPRLEGGRFRAAFSAGEPATDADLRLLDSMGIISPAGLPWDEFWRPLRTRVIAGLNQGQPPDCAAAIKEMRDSWSDTAAAAFDALVKMAVAGQARAVETLRLLRADSRFGFACHPAIESDGQGVSLRPAVVGDAVEWRDDPQVPVDRDIEVMYAFAPARARRIVSRGQPAEASPEAYAARFEAATPAGSPARAAAERLRTAIDRRRMFHGAREDSLTAVVAAANSLAACGQAEAWVTAAFQELSNCCGACEGKLVPADWNPITGVSANGIGNPKVVFHGTVPQGRAVLERFGVTTAAGEEIVAPEFARSAGPEPVGYPELLEKVGLITVEGEAVAKLRQQVLDFPRRVEAGQGEMAIPGLFDVAWAAKLAAPDQADVEAAVQAVHQLLERSYEMVVFRPKVVSECPEGWLRTRANGEPRGNRVELVRPGVRTRDNKLVRPAIVETE